MTWLHVSIQKLSRTYWMPGGNTRMPVNNMVLPPSLRFATLAASPHEAQVNEAFSRKPLRRVRFPSISARVGLRVSSGISFSVCHKL